MGDYRPGKLAGGDQTGLQMNVGIDESGTDYLAGHIHFGEAFISTQTYNEALSNGNVAMLQGTGEDVHIGGTFQDQVRLLTAGGYIDDVLFLDQPAVDFTGPCFGVTHRIDLLD